MHRRGALTTALLAFALLACRPASPPREAAPAPPRQGTVDTVSFRSQSLGVSKDAVVWLPPSYATSPRRRYPVAYYLHGLWGSEGDWTRQGALHTSLDSLVAAGTPEMIVVMPDGDDGWYTTWNRLPDLAACRAAFRPRPGDPTADSYCVPWPHYDDYIARDLVAFIDSTFRTRPSRAHRGIAGLSMGGFGAVTLALAYPDVFSATASHAGVLSPLYDAPRPFDGTPRYAPSVEALRARYGARWPLVAPAFGSDTMGWWARDPARLARRLVRERPALVPAIWVDSGTEDSLVDHARAFRTELRALGIEPRYAEWPGVHDWPYWRRHGPASAAWLARQLSGRGDTARR